MDLEELLGRIDIVDYVSQYVELIFKNGEYWGHSPFNDKDMNPSFSVNKEKQVYMDFSSGKSGDILGFIQEYHKCSFKEAINKIKEFLNVSEDEIFIETPEIIKTLRKYKNFPKCKKNIERKTLSPNYMNNYSKEPIKLWLDEGISQEVMDRYNVRYDRTKDAICFPIYDTCGNMINVKGRNVMPLWKELGMSKYFYYFKLGTLNYFWALNFKIDIIKACREVIIFEGEKSVMKMDGWGIENSVALCNGALTDEQLVLLIKLGVNVVFALDKDKDPTKDNNIKKLTRYCMVEYIKDTQNLLGEKDSPCDKGLEVWQTLYKERRRLK